MKRLFKSAWRRTRRGLMMLGVVHDPLKIEFVLNENCNLNCKGCTHYSPLAPAEMEPLEAVERDMKRIAPICDSHLERVAIVGGETLLYPQLPEAMRMLARHFPRTPKVIYTNGLLLPRMGEDFWEAVRDSDITIELTRYPVKFDYDAAIRLCHDKGVKLRVYSDRGIADSFFKFALDPAGSQNARRSHIKCFNRGCITVTGGKLFPCATSAFISRLNKISEHQFTHSDGDWIDLDQLTDLRQVKRMRDKPVPFCRYCINPPHTVSYGPSRRVASEWVESE